MTQSGCGQGGDGRRMAVAVGNLEAGKIDRKCASFTGARRDRNPSAMSFYYLLCYH